METRKAIPQFEFRSKYKIINGEHRSAIFQERKSLMEEIYSTGIPIYCDQSYYVQEQKIDLVEKVGDNFQCDMYENFEEWRDCHYYSLYEDTDGNKIWLMKGGRYD